MQFHAPRPQDAYKPAFSVEILEGTRKRTVCKRDPEKGFRYEDVEEPAGYLVTFPRGHSIRVKDKQELQRLGFTEALPIVDMSTGDVITMMPPVVKKDK